MFRSRAFGYVSNMFETQTNMNVSLSSSSFYTSLYSVSLPLPRSLYSTLITLTPTNPRRLRTIADFKFYPSALPSPSLSILRSILSLSRLPRSPYVALFCLYPFSLALYRDGYEASAATRHLEGPEFLDVG